MYLLYLQFCLPFFFQVLEVSYQILVIFYFVVWEKLSKLTASCMKRVKDKKKNLRKNLLSISEENRIF